MLRVVALLLLVGPGLVFAAILRPAHAYACSYTLPKTQESFIVGAAESQLIVVGLVTAERETTVALDGLEYGSRPDRTMYASTVEIVALLQGTFSAPTVDVLPLGTLAATCDGGPRLAPGDRVLLFLNRFVPDPERGFPWSPGPLGTYRFDSRRASLIEWPGNSLGAAFMPLHEDLIDQLAAAIPISDDVKAEILAFARGAPRALPTVGSGGLAADSGHTLPAWVLGLALGASIGTALAGTAFAARARRSSQRNWNGPTGV